VDLWVKGDYLRGTKGMAIAVDRKRMVSSEELLMSQVVQQEALIRLLVEKGMFTKEEFLEMVDKVNLEMKKMV
jgi:hypothetical protein